MKPNVAEFEGAPWDNHIISTYSTTVEAAKKYAEEHSNITFFFYCREHMTFEPEPHRTFDPGTAVFFSGKPWYGTAPQCDAYEKNK